MQKKYPFLVLLLALLSACGPSEEEQLDQSRRHMQEGQYQEAIKTLDALLAENPQEATAYNMRGVAYLESGQPQDAVSDFSQAIRHNAQDYRFWFNRGNARLQTGDLANALLDYNEAIRLQPDVADIYLNRAAVLTQIEQLPAALQDIRLALQQAPQDALVQLNAGKIYYALDSMPQASRHLTESVRLDAKRGEAFYLLGTIHKEQGDAAQACTLYRQAAQLGYQEATAAAQSVCP
jgi:Flp pilus assembly protein TadD